MKKYDSVIVGPVSLDINIDCEGNERRELGGAVVQAGWAAAGCGFRPLVLTKADPKTADPGERFRDSGVDLVVLESKNTCSIENRYLTPDKERRICTSLSVCDPFLPGELAFLDGYEVGVMHLAGLVWGDFSDDLIRAAKRYGPVAVDAQCLLRRVQPDRSMAYGDWTTKREMLPEIDFFKVDAAEGEMLTGFSDREKAARTLCEWGAKEVMLTHNTEVMICDGERIYTSPIKSRNLSGRTGRGDTTFSGYINERLTRGIEESLLFCSALVSLKMETPGPFRGTRVDVEDYITAFYR